MDMPYHVISADCHIDMTWMPGDLWVSHAPAQYYQLNLSMKPSEFWRRQGYSTYRHEPSVAAMIPLIGEDNIMWGSDYPHPDGIWPDSRHYIAADLGTVDERVRRKIICDNAAKLYGLL
jgi:uncharacterized protein